MSGLTPEAARAAADTYAAEFGSGWPVVGWFRALADRLEAAAKTPGQVAFAEWCEDHGGETGIARMDRVAAAVIAHHVGSDRVVVDRVDALGASKNLDHSGYHTLAGRIAKALS